MADVLIITPQPITTTNANYTASGSQELRLAIDVSAYDILDVQVQVLTFTGATSLDVQLVHAFQNQLEDITWDIATAASANILATTTATAVSCKNIQGPAANSVMFRYIRWRAKINAGTATWTMIAMARRRSF